MPRSLGHSAQAPGPEPSEPGCKMFVWGVWLILTVALLAIVAKYSANVPRGDDYALVDYVIGVTPVTLDWLWAQHNEHRIGLSKFILVVSEHLSGNDVRAGMYIDLALLSALAAALIRLSSRLPGGLRLSDIIFPLLLLHLGHAGDVLWASMLSHVLGTSLGLACLIPIARRPEWPPLTETVFVAIAMALLPHCGGTGLMYVPGLAFWLSARAWSELRSTETKRRINAAIIVASSMPGLLATVLYFRNFQKGIHPETEHRLLESARAGVQFLSGGLGMTAAQFWPWVGAFTIILVAMTLVWLGRSYAALPGERPRVLGFLAFLTAPLGLAAAVAWGRGWAGEMAGFQDRYVTIAVPLWCWIALGLRLYGPPIARYFLPNVLAAVLLVIAWPNAMGGLDQARDAATRNEALIRDIRSGQPPFRIAARYTPFLLPSHDYLTELLPKLREKKVGPFQYLREDPVLKQIPVPVEPSSLQFVRWENGTAHVENVDPQITFRLPEPRPVAGIRIRYSHSNKQGAPARFKLGWRRPGQREYTDAQLYSNWYMPTGDGKETTVWIDDDVYEFRIQPDNQKCEFKIDAITLLVP